MGVSHGEGLATHTGLEPCVAVRKFSHEALVKKRAMLRHAMRTEGQGQQIPSHHAHPVSPGQQVHVLEHQIIRVASL
jgi:hypothetical protein